MENKIYLCKIGKSSELLEKMIMKFTEKFQEVVYIDNTYTGSYKNKKILFAVQLEAMGVNLEMEPFINRIYNSASENQLQDSIGAILIHAKEEMYTKTKSSMLVFRLNYMGMRFPGRPMVEAPDGLRNYITPQKRNGESLEENCYMETLDLATRFSEYKTADYKKAKPKILTVHASEEGSNTLYLWKLVKKYLDKDDQIKEIYIPNGDVKDCEGCSYTVCKHFAKQKSCYYGGIMVEEVYPAILEADILILLCPNYNDAITANLSAMINRLTAIFRHKKFHDKKLYSIIVSGSSGTEAIATQLIRALNMNKTFQLPPQFIISAIANDKGSIKEIEDIEKRAEYFSLRINEEENTAPN
ncbi:MAG: NAD(P)H-dependent oxidoreductase [Proteocatella sp.]